MNMRLYTLSNYLNAHIKTCYPVEILWLAELRGDVHDPFHCFPVWFGVKINQSLGNTLTLSYVSIKTMSSSGIAVGLSKGYPVEKRVRAARPSQAKVSLQKILLAQLILICNYI